MDIDNLDLAPLLEHLSEVFRFAPPEGAVVGRTALRDAVAEFLSCSQLQAEEIVDTLVMRNYLRLVATPEGPATWFIDSRPDPS
jgi:hypothetical protein